MLPINLTFGGVSDISDVASRFLTFVTSVVTNRLVSMSKYPPALVKFNNLINIVLELIPDEIDIPGTPLYLCGGLSDKFSIVKHTSMSLGLDAALLNKLHPLDYPNDAVFGPMPGNDY